MRLPLTGHPSESLRVPGNDCDGIQRSLARDNPRPQRITYEDIARLTAAQIAVCHFDDAPASPPANQQRDPDRVMPGEGIINLPRFCQLLTQIGYTGFVSLELFREDLWQQDPLQVARTGLEKMRRVCEAAIRTGRI